MGKQTCLEKNAIERRQEELVRNDYSKVDEYNSNHSDALSNGDPLGKGSGNGGHLHSVPNCNLPKTMYDYSSIDTRTPNIGGQYDIEGRNGIGGRIFVQNINIYNQEFEYGMNSVDTELNIQDGQIVIK